MACLSKSEGFKLYVKERRAEFTAAGHLENNILKLCAIDWDELPKKAQQEFLSYPREMQKNREMFQDKEFDWKNQPIVICSFSTYVQPGMKLLYLAAEVGLTAFSLNEGVIDNFGRLIDPGAIAKRDDDIGEATKTAERFGLPEAGTTPELRKYAALVTTIQNFLQKHNSQFPGKELLVFCLDSDFVKVSRCFDWLFQIARCGNLRPVKVLSLNSYAMWACNTPTTTLKAKENEKVKATTPKPFYAALSSEKEVEKCLKDVPNYKMYKELCCIYHYKIGKQIHHCTLNMSNRYAFSLLEILTLSNGMSTVVGKHMPGVYDPANEKKKRHDMLRSWGTTRFEEEMEEEPEEKKSLQETDDEIWREEKFDPEEDSS